MGGWAGEWKGERGDDGWVKEREREGMMGG